VDPHAVLGLPPDASPVAVEAAYRRLAKAWHPDLGGGARAAARMAELNAARDLLRAATASAGAAAHEQAGVAPPAPSAGRPPRGAWLSDEVRRALGRELVAALEPGEPVELVTRTATWKSPEALLVVTDRRLLWLLDDAPVNRVRSLRFRDVAEVDHRLAWPRRRRATVRVSGAGGRRHAFADLAPATAARVAALVARPAPSA
jgi:hypothetical protein